MRFTGGSVTEEKRRNGKSFNPKHWRVCLSFTYDEEQADGTTKKKRKRVSRIVEGTKTHSYEVRDQLIAELDDKGETLDEVVQRQKEQERVENMTLTKLIELWDAARRTASKAPSAPSPRTAIACATWSVTWATCPSRTSPSRWSSRLTPPSARSSPDSWYQKTLLLT